MRVNLTARAERDLMNIIDFIAADNRSRARTFAQELRAKCADLATMPDRFPLVRIVDGKSVRRRLYRDYLIIYAVDPTDVTILHIVHGARDLEMLLGPE